MSDYPKIILKKAKDLSVLRRHPWVFSGAIDTIEGSPKDGDLVTVYNAANKVLGVGHYQQATIAVRLLSFKPVIVDQDYWNNAVAKAYQLRQQLGLAQSKLTNAYRLIHGEGDNLPGLIVDIYDTYAVVQSHSMGMHESRNTIAEALKNTYKSKLKGIYYKPAFKSGSGRIKAEYLLGESAGGRIKENGLSFEVNWEAGQKTGFFLDQRENRKYLGEFSKDAKVLNMYAYTGGFSLYALAGGAAQVDSVDSSKPAIETLEDNVKLNGFSQHQSFAVDAMDFLKGMPTNKYDVIVLDPPAFAKHQSAKHNAVQAYKRINTFAINKINAGGILFTFSCSQAIDKKLFADTIRAAAIEAGREVQILQHISQPADHPVNIFHPEGEYIKGLVLRVS